MAGATLLHEWVNCNEEQIAEDRRADMAWSYIEGCFEGIKEAYSKSTNEI